MAKFGNCDFKQLEELQKKLQRLQGNKEFYAFCESCAKELAARLLAKVIKRTPVGEYESSSGKVGGTLRRGWTTKTEEEAQGGGNPGAKAYADSLKVHYYGGTYVVEVTNPVHYASYVEFGHRTANHEGWVKGQFMLTISEQELQTQAPKILERKLTKYLGECFNA